MPIWGSNQISKPNMGSRVWRGRGVLPWWNPDGETLGGIGGDCVGAYQAKSAATYLASLVNLANPGTNDLVEGNGAVPWAGGTGWGFVTAAAQWFNTGLVPANDQSWSMLVQFSNSVNPAADVVYCGLRNGGGREFLLTERWVQVRYANGGQVNIPPSLGATGNLGVAGAQGYRNGIADGGAIGIWTGASIRSIYIGRSNAAAPSYCTADIESIAIYNVILTAPQVAARATAMAAL